MGCDRLEGFWVGTSPTDRVFVFLTPGARSTEGESPFQVEAGQSISLEGTLVPLPGAPETPGVEAAEGADQLLQQGHIVEATVIALTWPLVECQIRPNSTNQERHMNIDKSQILELLRSRGDDDKAEQADRELPDQVDTDRDSGLLDRFGLDIGDLAKKFGGGGLGKLIG